MGITLLQSQIIPEVLAGMIKGRLSAQLAINRFAKIDYTLVGQPGDTISIPRYGHIPDATVVGENEQIPTHALTTSMETYTIKKVAVGGMISDEAQLSAYGDPMGELANQIVRSMANGIDNDAFLIELLKATQNYIATDIINYSDMVGSLDLFAEEFNSDKLMYIHPAQMSQIRDDTMFISSDTYSGNIVMTGEIGKIANTTIVVSKKVVVDGDSYINPIIKLNANEEFEDPQSALTIYMKRDLMLESKRMADYGRDEIYGNQHYVAALTNDSRVVLAKFKKEKTIISGGGTDPTVLASISELQSKVSDIENTNPDELFTEIKVDGTTGASTMALTADTTTTKTTATKTTTKTTTK